MPNDGELIKKHELECSQCGGPLRFQARVLNTRTGEPIRIFECEKCDEITWEDFPLST